MIRRSTDGRQRVLSLSYGKDSMACLGAIEALDWPLDRIVTADLWATPDIPADLPPMVKFKEYADCLILERYGIRVEHFTTKRAEGITGERVSYEECFYRKMTAGKFVGRIKGFPMVKGNWCTKLKLNALKQIEETTNCCEQCLGIAADEDNRIERHSKRAGIKLPLLAVGWTEQDARQWCEENKLLSPIYTKSTRGGVGSATIRALGSSASSDGNTRSFGRCC